MKKEILYTYLGLNGTITTPVQLEGIYSIRKVSLRAEDGMSLTKDGKTSVMSVVVPESEVDLWKEVPVPAGQK